jgi:hypothetical protein
MPQEVTSTSPLPWPDDRGRSPIELVPGRPRYPSKCVRLRKGSFNWFCVSTLLDTGIVPMSEPETRLVLEAPGGPIDVTAHCMDGKAERIPVRNLP